MKNQALLLSLIIAAVSASEESSGVEYPDVFDHVQRGGTLHRCDDNGVVAAWCDSRISTELECGILPEFDEYGCTCYGKPALCPTECIGDSGEAALLTKTHYGIRCSGIPADEPNFVLKEKAHAVKHGCGNNAPVAAWCDDFVNMHLECGLFPEGEWFIVADCC